MYEPEGQFHGKLGESLYGEVFLNIPFDQSYEPLQHALICALVACGKTPRCARELDLHSTHRMEKIIGLLHRCAFSIHDLSRTARGRPPRFNMPFELGIAYHQKTIHPDKYDLIVLQKRKYRLQRTLSDLNAYDPKEHAGSPAKLVGIVVEWLTPVLPAVVSPAAVRRLLDEFQIECQRLRLPRARTCPTTLFGTQPLWRRATRLRSAVLAFAPAASSVLLVEL